MNPQVPTSSQADDPATDDYIDVSRSYGHLPCFDRLLPLVVRVNPHTYLSTVDEADPLGTTWLSLALAGMEVFRSRRTQPVRKVAIIGTGNGLDAVGISHLLLPDELVASDLHARVLDAARWNIARYGRGDTCCEVFQSDLFRGYPIASCFDLVYENLPNVPEGVDLLRGIRAASCYSPESYRSDPHSDRCLLTLHYNCLLEARDHLLPGGWVVAMIGGRIPWRAIEQMFANAGYAAIVLHFGLKTQTEPGVVIDGYARAERNGSSPFTFYHPVDACGRILARHQPDPAGTWEARIEEANAELERHRVTACQAQRLHQEGEPVCHSVYVVGGTPAPAPGLQG